MPACKPKQLTRAAKPNLLPNTIGAIPKLMPNKPTNTKLHIRAGNNIVVKNYQINVDFGLVYGKDFAFLNQLEPHSVMLAEGSVDNSRKYK
jgi:hypothetical protein